MSVLPTIFNSITEYCWSLDYIQQLVTTLQSFIPRLQLTVEFFTEISIALRGLNYTGTVVVPGGLRGVKASLLNLKEILGTRLHFEFQVSGNISLIFFYLAHDFQTHFNILFQRP